MGEHFLFENFEKSISKDRLEHYRKLFSTNDKKVIIQKYLLNVALSKSLYFPLQAFETTLRNSIHTVLSSEMSNEFWFNDEDFLSNRLRAKIDEAKRRKLAARINTVRNLRNKIFHFDTIINIKNLADIHQEVLEFIYWLNKDIYKLTCLFDEFNNVCTSEENIVRIKLNELNKDNE